MTQNFFRENCNTFCNRAHFYEELSCFSLFNSALVVSEYVPIFSEQRVHQYERLVVFRLGRLQRPPRGPGLALVLPVLDRAVRIDMRLRAFTVPPRLVRFSVCSLPDYLGLHSF